MFESFGRSWRLVKASWSVLLADKELLVFPLVSTIGLIIVTIMFAVPFLASGILQALAGTENAVGQGMSVISFVIAFLFYMVTYTVIIFSNTALVSAVMIRLEGGDPTVADGFRAASQRIGSILIYAMISSTVGMLLRAIQEQDNIIARIAAGILGMAWNLMTFLVIPVLVVENIGPIEAIQRSAALLKQTWGEQIAGNFTLGGIFFLIIFAVLFLIGLPLFVLAVSVKSSLLIIVTVVGVILALVILGLFSSTLNTIYQAALYRYAAMGEVGEYFGEDMVQNAFKPKRKRGVF